MEMLRSHQRRLARIHEQRDEMMAELRSVRRLKKRHEYRRKTIERQKHKTKVRIGRVRETLELMDF